MDNLYRKVKEPEGHTHNENTFSANHKIICSDCVMEEDKHGDECFCNCHLAQGLSCGKCKIFHNKLYKGYVKPQ